MSETFKKMNFDGFYSLLVEYFQCYRMLMFSNLLLADCLINENNHDFLNKRQYDLNLTRKNSKTTVWRMDGAAIKQTVENWAKLRKTNYNEGCELIHAINAHYIRGRVLNAYYEIIFNYVYNRNNGKKLRKQLFNTDWFLVLYFLRNNASHFDNLDIEVDRKQFQNRDKVSWRNITIHKGQMGNTIEYNDADIVGLLTFILDFFLTNKPIYV